MKRTLQVCVGAEGRALGTLHYDQHGTRERVAFEYDGRWLADADRFALEPNLPLVSGPQFPRPRPGNSLFPAAISDTAPDGWARQVILRDHAKRRQQARRAGTGDEPARLNAVDFLLAVDDLSRVGALRYRDEAGVFQRAPEPGRRTVPPLLELPQLLRASHAVETDTETAEDLAYLRGRGTSLGGLRPKCSVIDADGLLAIGKFPSVQDERAITKGEVLAMVLARSAGITVASARLVESDGIPVAVIRRFDRTPDGRRLMYVSAATLLATDANDATAHTYAEIVDALRMNGAAAQADIDELWRRIAFSILVTNVDDHLHNHGFLHVEHGLWRLSPAFDLNPFPDRARELKTWISAETGPEASIDSLMSATGYFQMPVSDAKRILGEVEHAVAAWRMAGKKLGMTARELDAFADAFEHPERSVARKLSS